MNWSKFAGCVPAGAGDGHCVAAPRSVGRYGPRPHRVESAGTAGHIGDCANTMFLLLTPCRLPQLLAITTEALPFGATRRKSTSLARPSVKPRIETVTSVIRPVWPCTSMALPYGVALPPASGILISVGFSPKKGAADADAVVNANTARAAARTASRRCFRMVIAAGANVRTAACGMGGIGGGTFRGVGSPSGVLRLCLATMLRAPRPQGNARFFSGRPEG